MRTKLHKSLKSISISLCGQNLEMVLIQFYQTSIVFGKIIHTSSFIDENLKMAGTIRY
jgi:hypothetical protein